MKVYIAKMYTHPHDKGEILAVYTSREKANIDFRQDKYYQEQVGAHNIPYFSHLDDGEPTGDEVYIGEYEVK